MTISSPKPNGLPAEQWGSYLSAYYATNGMQKTLAEMQHLLSMDDARGLVNPKSFVVADRRSAMYEGITASRLAETFNSTIFYLLTSKKQFIDRVSHANYCHQCVLFILGVVACNPGAYAQLRMDPSEEDSTQHRKPVSDEVTVQAAKNSGSR